MLRFLLKKVGFTGSTIAGGIMMLPEGTEFLQHKPPMKFKVSSEGLLKAIYLKKTCKVEFLLDQGVDPNALNEGLLPLNAAIK